MPTPPCTGCAPTGTTCCCATKATSPIRRSTLDAFAALVEEGRLRAFGISTDSLEVLQRFNARGDCSVVQIDYSLVNLQAEAELLPYCQEHGIAVLVRGPLAKGLLSGRYTKESVFTDEVRQSLNAGEPQRAKFEAQLAQVERLAEIAAPGEAMVEKALQYVISIQPRQWAIPGAKSAAQARANAAAGAQLLPADEIERLRGI